MRRVWLSVLMVAGMCVGALGDGSPRPILYSTDLFHPHADPDDHYDLACLFAMPEFEIKGIILDLGAEQAKGCGRPAVEQMMRITGRKAPVAIGLSEKLSSRADKALDQPAAFQGAVALILSVLRDSPEKVVLFTTGSCRDVAAALNREPELLKAKVQAVYFNIGRGPNEPQEECNVDYDPHAYLRLFESGLPIFWCPCFGKDRFETLYEVDQTAVVGRCAPVVQNYFVYCLTKSQADPIAFLTSGPHPLPTGPRAMWCTAPMVHAAGRKIYERGPNDFVALPPSVARQRGLSAKEVEAFGFVPMRASVEGGEPPAAPSLPKVSAGQLAAVYGGCEKDRVGTAKAEPDGQRDCCVRVVGVPRDKKIKNVVITGPRAGRWEYLPTDRWWRIAFDHGETLDCYFQFWAAGEHRVEVAYHDGSSQSASFLVPPRDTTRLRVALDPPQPNGFVFRYADARYKPIMASCLKNLLAELGR